MAKLFAFFKHPTTVKVLKAALYAALGALGYGQLGCGLLGAKPARVEHFDCQVRALEPLVGDVLDAAELVQQLYKGQASLQSVLGNLNATTEELVKLQADLQACEPPPPAPGAEQAS